MNVVLLFSMEDNTAIVVNKSEAFLHFESKQRLENDSKIKKYADKISIDYKEVLNQKTVDDYGKKLISFTCDFQKACDIIRSEFAPSTHNKEKLYLFFNLNKDDYPNLWKLFYTACYFITVSESCCSAYCNFIHDVFDCVTDSIEKKDIEIRSLLTLTRLHEPLIGKIIVLWDNNKKRPFLWFGQLDSKNSPAIAGNLPLDISISEKSQWIEQECELFTYRSFYINNRFTGYIASLPDAKTEGD